MPRRPEVLVTTDHYVMEDFSSVWMGNILLHCFLIRIDTSECFQTFTNGGQSWNTYLRDKTQHGP